MKDNRTEVRETVQSISDSETLKQLVSYLIEKITHLSTDNEIQRRELRRLRRELNWELSAKKGRQKNP